MTLREKEKIRESFQSMSELAGPLSLLFYGRLFEVDPALRPMFQGDIARQGLKLMEMIAAVVAHLDQVDSLQPVLRAMGQRHRAYGVLPRHYESVEAALIWSMRQAMGADLDGEAQAAWRKVIQLVSEAMKAGAEEVPEG